MNQAIVLFTLILLAFGAAFIAVGARAVVGSIVLTFQDHRSDRAQAGAPARTKLKLVERNLGAAPKVHANPGVKREEAIAGKGQASISMAAVKRGTGESAGEFSEGTAQAQIAAN